MQTIDDCYQFIKLLANKNQQGLLSPGDFNKAWGSAEMQLFKARDGKPEEYQPGRPVPRVAYAMTRKVADDLDRFVERAAFTPTPTVPYWVRPADMVRLVAVLSETPAGLVPVEEITHAELGDRLANSIAEPSPAYPVTVAGAGQYEVYPPGLTRLLYTYLRYPVVGKWVGTLANGRLVYDPVNSLQPEWPRDTWNELCIRAASFLGMNLKAADLVQFAAVKEQQGI